MKKSRQQIEQDYLDTGELPVEISPHLDHPYIGIDGRYLLDKAVNGGAITQFLNDPESKLAIFVGKPGTGKTRSLFAAGIEYLAREHSVQLINWNDMVKYFPSHPLAKRDLGDISIEMYRLHNTKLLLIDEVGTIDNQTDRAAIEKLIDYHHSHGYKTIMVTNMTSTEFNSQVSGRICDRIDTIIKFKGESLRPKKEW